MTTSALLLMMFAVTPVRDTVPSAPATDSSVVTDSALQRSAVMTSAAMPPAVSVATDTVPRPRRRSVEVSDAYATRLRIHRIGSYTLVPLFAAQSIAGNQMYQSGGPTPRWAKTVHGVGAGGLAALFTVNTVTGVWNLWDSRSNTQGRTLRLIHSGLMLASDAGFTYAGVKLGPEGTTNFEKRQQHRTVAMISMGSALVGYATMYFGNR